jgi:sterol 3beta-glucosyltransferase
MLNEFRQSLLGLDKKPRSVGIFQRADGQSITQLHCFSRHVVPRPHDWLFPLMSAVVHHGGAGTTAAGLRAGRPSFICPFIGDQPFWGRRVYQLGVGPKPIPQKKLTVIKLAQAIQDATQNQALRRKAQDLSLKIRAEDGITGAISIIENLETSN